MSNMNVCGYEVSTVIENGIKTITIKVKEDNVVKGNLCFTRTKVAGYLATGKKAVINDNFEVVVSDFAEPVTCGTVDGATKELQKKFAGAKIKVDTVTKQEAGVTGIPRELFDIIASKATRPESQR